MYKNLYKYIQEHGGMDGLHSETKGKYAKLGKWVTEQRNIFRNYGKQGRRRRRRISKETYKKRKKKLDEIAFIYSTFDTQWKERYKELEAYYKEHGNCNVPQKYDENPKLGKWVAGQRRSNKKGKCSKDHLELLEKIGFTWRISEDEKHQDKWDEMYEKLESYKKENGNCDVPSRHGALGKWLMRQRTSGELIPNRKQLLEEIGVNFDRKHKARDEKPKDSTKKRKAGDESEVVAKNASTKKPKVSDEENENTTIEKLKNVYNTKNVEGV